MLAEMLRRLRPYRRWPTPVRYLATALMVLACFALRYWLGALDIPDNLPLYLVFMPAVLLASFMFDRGSGYFAVLLSAVLGSYFFPEPWRAVDPQQIGPTLRLGAFVLIGLFTAAMVEALRGMALEFTETNKALEEARSRAESSNALLSALLDGTPDPIFIKDRQGRYVHVNAATTRLMRAPGSNLIGKRTRDFLAENEARAIEAVDDDVMATGRVRVVEEVVTSGTGVPRTYLSTKAPWFGPDGEVVGLICVTHDIHRRKLDEERVRIANAQRQLLLEDINHRIKNHLQSLTAQMFRSKQAIGDERARNVLDTAIGHLHVLARVYDRLQLTSHATAVNAREFIGDLCADLNATVADPKAIVLRTHIEPVMLNSGRAVLVGLVINELVTNAFKHAFPGDREGEIVVALRRADDKLSLYVRDDGVGMEASDHRGRGRRLVRSFANELGGSVEWHHNGGTRVTLTFPLLEASGQAAAHNA